MGVLIVGTGVHDCIKAFYRKEQPGEELDSFTDSQFIRAVLSCVVNCIAQSPSATEAQCLCIKAQRGSLKPNVRFSRACMCVIPSASATHHMQSWDEYV